MAEQESTPTMRDGLLADLSAVLSRDPQNVAPQDAQERYLISRVDGVRTLEELLRLSTLGPQQTMRVLQALAERGAVLVSGPRATGVRPGSSDSKTSRRLGMVVVADADRTQASLLRTMLRVSLGGTVVFHTVSDAEGLTTLAGKQGPDLLVVDYRLPGSGDGLALVRRLRAKQGATLTPALIVAQRIEADFIRSRLLPQTGLVVRPVERAALTSAIRDVVPDGE